MVAKLSGLMTEIIPGTGATGVVRPYLEYALEVFGPQRCLFGSDWPVLTLAGSYAEWRNTVLDAIAGLSEAEVEAAGTRSLWGEPVGSWRSGNLVGTPEQVSEKIRTYAELGCRGFIPWCADYPDTETLELFAREVIPAFR